MRQEHNGSGTFWFAALALAAAIAFLWRAMPMVETPLVLAGAVVAVVISVYRPLIPCLLCVGVIGFRLQDAFPFLYPFRLPVLTTAWALMSVALAGLTGQAAFRLPRPMRWMLAFAAATALSLVFAIDPARGWDLYVESYFKVLLVIFLILLVIQSERDLAAINLITVLFGILISAVVIYNKINHLEIVEDTRVTIGRSFGSPLGDPNDLALVLLVPLSFALGLSRHGTRGALPIGVVGVVLTLIAIVFTQSRGGILGVVLVLGLHGLRIVRSKLLLGALSIAAFAVLYVAMGIGDRSQAISVQGGLDSSAESRIGLWIIAIQTFFRHPLTGIGMENFPIIAAIHTGVSFPTHNTLLQALVETGLIGFFAFVGMLVSSTRAALHALARWDAVGGRSAPRVTAISCLAAIAGFLASSMFITHAYTWTIYYLVCLATVAYLVSPERQGQVRPSSKSAKAS